MPGSTLAYVFWHSPYPQVSPAEYETGLQGFHASLAAAPPPGFLGSASYRASRAPWEGAPLGPVVYVDWYVVEGWDGLGTLERDAVAPRHLPHHDVAARSAAQGYGGVYQLRHGRPEFAMVRFEGWVPKPRGRPSEEFAAGLVPTGDPPEASVWQRQLALGPAPEFCRRTRFAPARKADEEQRIEVRPVAVRFPR
jgi:hypothetical protein